MVENGSHDLSDVNGLHGIVRYLHSPRANSAVARNIGLRAARGIYLLLTDADCVVAADWVEAMCAALLDGQFEPWVAVFGPTSRVRGRNGTRSRS